MARDSLFDGLIETKDQFSDGEDRRVARAVVYLLLGEGGKVNVATGEALAKLFADAGCKREFDSWFERGSGLSLMLPPSQIEKVFGDEAISAFARLTGMQKHELLDRLVCILPKVVTRVMPHELHKSERSFHFALSSLLRSLS